MGGEREKGDGVHKNSVWFSLDLYIRRAALVAGKTGLVVRSMMWGK